MCFHVSDRLLPGTNIGKDRDRWWFLTRVAVCFVGLTPAMDGKGSQSEVGPKQLNDLFTSKQASARTITRVATGTNLKENPLDRNPGRYAGPSHFRTRFSFGK